MLEFFWSYSDTVMPLIPIAGLVRVKHLHRQDRLLLGYYIFCFALFATTNYMADRRINNMFLYHIFSLVELMLVFRYAAHLFNSTRVHSVLSATLILYAIYWVINIWVWEPLTQFNSNSASIANLLILIVCGLFFLSLSAKKELLYFQRLPQFWVGTAFLFYCACSIPVLLAYKYWDIFYDFDISDAWHIQVVANFIKFVLLSYASLCSYRYQGGS